MLSTSTGRRLAPPVSFFFSLPVAPFLPLTHPRPGRNADTDVPEMLEETLGLDTVKVEALVQEFLMAQSLKILPTAPFGDAVNQFVNKDDKHAMEEFVSESLAGQVKQMLSLDSDEEDLDNAMEAYRAKLEEQFSKGALKRSTKRTVKPKPDEWDSDLDGHWEDQPGVVETETVSQAPARSRRAQTQEDDDLMDMEDEPAVRPAPARKAAATRATKAAPAKKAPAKKAPAKKAPARGRKKPVFEEESEEEDVVMDDDFEEPPAPTRARRSQPARAPPKSRQTKLNFSQATTSQAAVEISDDEISDEDAFEPPPPTTRSRRR